MRAHLPFTADERAWREHHFGLVVPDHHFATPERRLAVVSADEIVHGFDVSSYQPAGPDFAVGGRRFAIFKATEGLSYFDPHFGANRARAHAEGLPFIGMYAFARPSASSGAAQARYLLSKVGARQRGEVLICDFEVSPWSVAWIVDFLTTLHAAGWPTEFYSYLGMLSANPTGGVPETGTGLWVAAYGTREPGSDRWPYKDLWQHTDGSASVPGNDGPWDCNRGLASLLSARAGGSPTPPPAPPVPPGPPPEDIDDLFTEITGDDDNMAQTFVPAGKRRSIELTGQSGKVRVRSAYGEESGKAGYLWITKADGSVQHEQEVDVSGNKPVDVVVDQGAGAAILDNSGSFGVHLVELPAST